MKTVFRAAALVLILSFGMVPSWAQAQTTKKNDEKATTPAAGMAGQRVYVDPATGKLRPPNPEEARQLSEAMSKLLDRSTGNLQLVQHPEGYWSVYLQGRFLNVSVAKINADGTVSQECVTDAGDASKFLTPSERKPARRRTKEALDVR